jgi:hypothetical protein
MQRSWFSLRSYVHAPAVALLTGALAASPVCAQLIQVKTLPIADGDQWRLFPSANQGIGDLSIALPDSLHDPFENPAKGSRVSERSRGLFFGSPTFYSVSSHAGGGTTFPVGGILRRGSTFAGLAVAMQEIVDPNSRSGNVVPPGIFITTADGAALPPQATPSRQNRFAFGTIGRVFSDAGISIGANALWSGLNDIDGVDQLYTGSQNIVQHGGSLDVRLGALKEWSGGQSFEAMVLHDRFNMTHDVTWLDPFWDPNTRSTVQRARMDHNLDRTNTWGMHFAYVQPLDSGWRVGAIATTNLMSHPKLPDYQIAQVMTIPWDPGHTAAYDLGVGIARTTRLTTYGIDAIYEPIRTHTWGEVPDSLANAAGGLPAGSKTTENWFRFSNAILRGGVAREFPLDTLYGAIRSVRMELGLTWRSIDYALNQTDHVAGLDTRQTQSWAEWTRTWGFALRFSDLQFRYTGRMTTGTGRPGVVPQGVLFAPAPAEAAPNFLSAPSAVTSLTGVSVTTHQIAVSIPIR